MPANERVRSTLSRRRHGFESRMGLTKENTCKSASFWDSNYLRDTAIEDQSNLDGDKWNA